MTTFRNDARWQRARAAYVRRDYSDPDTEICALFAAAAAMYLVEAEHVRRSGDAAERLLDWTADVEANSSPTPQALAA